MFDSSSAQDGPPVPADWDLDDALLGRVPAAEIVADGLAGCPGAGRVQLVALVDPARLDRAGRLDHLRVLERQLRWLQARQLHALAVIAAADSGEGWSSIDVARALDLSDAHAASELQTSAALGEMLPATMRALGEGLISRRHAEAILDTARTIGAELHPELEAAALPKALGQTVPELRRALLRIGIRLDARAAERRRRLAHADRRVQRRPLADGMAEFTAVLPAQDAEAMFARLDAATALLPTGDTRTLDQQRADLLIDAVLSGLPHDALPELQGRRPTIGVIIGLSTLLGLDDEPADLTGHGAITAQHGREIAADYSATWHRFVTDPVTGHLLDYGHTTYHPPQQLRDFITHRSPTCAHPGCRRPAYRCDLDHRTPHPTRHGGDHLTGRSTAEHPTGRGSADQLTGRTSAENMFPLCRRHHQAKTSAGWTYHPHPDGGLSWHAPTGHTYQKTTPERWLHPGEAPIPPGPVNVEPLYTDCYATHHQRNQQRHREHLTSTGTSGTEPETTNPDPGTTDPKERLTNYLDSLPPHIPPF